MDKEKEIENKIPQKPLVILRKECFDSLVKIINESELPAFIIESMLRDLLIEAQTAMRTEYETTFKWYNEQCNNKQQKEFLSSNVI